MEQPRVVRKVKVESGWKFLAVGKVNGKLDWTRVNLHGNPIPSVAGTFYLDYREDGKRKRRPIGSHPREAKAALETQTAVRQLRAKGVTVEDAPQIQRTPKHSGPTIASVVDGFFSAPPIMRDKSISKYRNAHLTFKQWSKATHLSQLTRDDLMRYMSYLVDVEKLDRSTALDKGHVVHSVMNKAGADIRMKRGDWPKATQIGFDVYKAPVLRKLFNAATPEELTLFQTFLLTGFRDQEVGFLSWDDFNPEQSTLSVTTKPGLRFIPKNYQERTIPVPHLLVELLEAHRLRQGKGEYLIFPTGKSNKKQGRSGGQRDRHMLDWLKHLAKRAGLNCGRCKGTFHNKRVTCADASMCQQFGLHLFRHTYATTLLQDGVDLVSLQKLLGHADLESTRKYLRASEPADLLKKINNTTISTKIYRQVTTSDLLSTK